MAGAAADRSDCHRASPGLSPSAERSVARKNSTPMTANIPQIIHRQISCRCCNWALSTGSLGVAGQIGERRVGKNFGHPFLARRWRSRPDRCRDSRQSRAVAWIGWPGWPAAGRENCSSPARRFAASRRPAAVGRVQLDRMNVPVGRSGFDAGPLPLLAQPDRCRLVWPHGRGRFDHRCWPQMGNAPQKQRHEQGPRRQIRPAGGRRERADEHAARAETGFDHHRRLIAQFHQRLHRGAGFGRRGRGRPATRGDWPAGVAGWLNERQRQIAVQPCSAEIIDLAPFELRQRRMLVVDERDRLERRFIVGIADRRLRTGRAVCWYRAGAVALNRPAI